MTSKKNFRTFAQITLVVVYLIIVAGAVVRMTGSGMGCPDWPKCFGYYVPPVSEEKLWWQPERSFEEGQVIIKDQALLVAKADFTTGNRFSEENWEPYTKHDYAIFNATHTWVEYINRLIGALGGLLTLALAIYSLKYRKSDPWLPILAWLTVFGMGFQAWLGATVVYSVLAPVRITMHMIMALIIVALLLRLIYLSKENKLPKCEHSGFKILVAISLMLTAVQIILGTQVRQFVDEQVALLGSENKNLWLQEAELSFYVHRTFSILVFAVNAYLFYLNRLRFHIYSKINIVMMLLLLEIFSGIIMYYVDFPFGSQSLHLVIASILFGVQFYLLQEVNATGYKRKSL
ncbi:COX15/CtaA family protein [Robertkochia aurantiaca]|uniref:COX15/CtaA family protein n=1 Tax=Robertkochia aurantiaca TaxID=2873700 RepID=UPI001CC93B0D|nr:COX15/CtaA family protein [Robertkochia sp. 3YJGBD-33]